MTLGISVRCRSHVVEVRRWNRVKAMADHSLDWTVSLLPVCGFFFSFYVFFLAGASKRRVPCLFVRYNNHVIGIIMHGSPFKCAPTEGHLADKHFWGLIRL